MCGRYAQGRAIPNLLARYAHLGAELIAAEQVLLPSFNVAPGTDAAVVFLDAGKVSIGPMRWGLVPRWTKSLAHMKQKPINAKSETADTSPFFRDAFRSARCLVPAMGFFEWQGKKPPKQPYYIHPAGHELFSFAGLWSRWNDPAGGAMCTFAILTTEANAVVKPIHDRMPCILPPKHEAAWLGLEKIDVAAAKALLVPCPVEKIAAHPVSALVNKPGNGGPELLQPVALGGKLAHGLDDAGQLGLLQIVEEGQA